MQSSMIIHPEELSREWIDRLAEAGVGILGIHPRGGNCSLESLKNLLEQAKTKEYRDLIDYAHSRGLEVEYEVHAMGYLLDRNLFETHPEYFRMNTEGERTNDYNMCVSNPEAVALVAQNAATLAQSLYGSNHNFYFWLDDGHKLTCQCPLCKNMSPSDQQQILLNAMLQEIRKSIPDARMAYLAYYDTLVPPQNVKPVEGIFLEYAPLEKYVATGAEAFERIACEKEMIPHLVKTFANEPKKVLEYWYDNSMFSRWKKPPKKFTLDAENMLADMKEYKRFGFDSFSTFACFLGKDYEELHGDVDVSPFGKALREEA